MRLLRSMLFALIMIPGLILGSIWLAGPLLVPEKAVVSALRAQQQTLGIKIEVQGPAEVVYTPLPAMRFAQFSVRDSRGAWSWQGDGALVRLSPLLLLNPSLIAGSLRAENGTLAISSPMLELNEEITSASAELRRSFLGPIAVRIDGASSQGPVSVDWSIVDIGALTAGRSSETDFDLSTGALTARYSGHIRTAPKGRSVVDFVGRVEADILEPQKWISNSVLAPFLSDVGQSKLSGQVNVSQDKLLIQLRATAERRGYPVSAEVSLTGESGWHRTGLLNAGVVSRAGGLYTAEAEVVMNWLAPQSQPITGPAQIAILDPNALGSWLGLSPSEVPANAGRAHVSGELHLHDSAVSLRNPVLTPDGGLRFREIAYRIDNPRPLVSVSLRNESALAEPNSLGLKRYQEAPFDVAVETEVSEFLFGPLPVADARILVRSEETGERVSLLDSAQFDSTIGAEILTTEAGQSVNIELNSVDLSKFPFGALKGNATGAIKLSWPSQSYERRSADGTVALRIRDGTLMTIGTGASSVSPSASILGFGDLNAKGTVSAGRVEFPDVSLLTGTTELKGRVVVDLVGDVVRADLSEIPSGERVTLVGRTGDQALRATTSTANRFPSNSPIPTQETVASEVLVQDPVEEEALLQQAGLTEESDLVERVPSSDPVAVAGPATSPVPRPAPRN